MNALGHTTSASTSGHCHRTSVAHSVLKSLEVARQVSWSHAPGKANSLFVNFLSKRTPALSNTHDRTLDFSHKEKPEDDCEVSNPKCK